MGSCMTNIFSGRYPLVFLLGWELGSGAAVWVYPGEWSFLIFRVYFYDTYLFFKYTIHNSNSLIRIKMASLCQVFSRTRIAILTTTSLATPFLDRSRPSTAFRASPLSLAER